MMTFEEINDRYALYTETEVDQATQAALLEWQFDSYLSMEDESESEQQKWIRRYRRYVNLNYPIYKDLLKMDIARSTMDPFITELVNKVMSGTSSQGVTGSTTQTGSDSKTGQTTRDTDTERSEAGSRSDNEHTVTDDTEIRTPDLTASDAGTSGNTKTSSASDQTVTDNTELRTPDLTTSGTNGNTRTDATQVAVSGTDTGTVSTDTNIDTEDDSKQRGMTIAYPESNLGSIPMDINSFPSNIAYASGEADQFSHGTHTEDNDSTETRNLSNSSTTTNSGTVTDTGSSSQHETGTEQSDFDGTVTKTLSGTDTDSGTTSNTHTETGTEQKDFDGDVTRTLTASDSKQGSENTDETVTSSESGTSQSSVSTNQTTTGSTGGTEGTTGRHESMADILPRAVSAIKSTNALKWFVKSLEPCFDLYAEL